MVKEVKIKLELNDNVLRGFGIEGDDISILMPRMTMEVKRRIKQRLPGYKATVEQKLIQNDSQRQPVLATILFASLEECRGREAQVADAALTEAVNRTLKSAIQARIRKGKTVPGMIYGNAFMRDVYLNGKKLDPRPSQKINNHSPDGFCWGYGGSGPSQLALAILLRFMTRKEAAWIYHDFKWSMISGLEMNRDFFLPIESVKTWIEQNRYKLAA